jgi:hypothetical protein
MTASAKIRRALVSGLSELSAKQIRLKVKHGTPAEFARAVYECVPGDISMDEARAAIEKYNQEWLKASP